MASSESLPFPAQSHYINNQKHLPEKYDHFYTVNPATNTTLAQIPIATNEDLSYAISAAQTAFDTWSQTPPVERSRILLRAVAILRERNDEIARVESLDTGKAYSETSTVDVATGADVLEYFAGVGMAAGEGKTIQLREDAWVYTRKEALGVCVGIGAWNYPIQIALWKCAPALAAGNTFVFKPSEVTPLTANMLAEVFIKAGLPKGVFNVVHGGPTVGAWLTQCKDVAKISFTGQPSTGVKVYAASAGSLKAITLELGGKSPFIVFPDADLSAAADLAMTANFYSTGQVCTNGTRVFVHSSVAKEFTNLMLARISEGGIRAGDPAAPNTNFGPVVSKAQFDKIRGYIQHGIETDRATLLTGGVDVASLGLPKELSEGFFIPPTIFTDCKDDMKIVQEEIFGPVMCILTFEDEDEVIRRANDTELGLAAGVMTRDLRTAHRVMAKVKAGICWINTWGESPAQMPVGGWGMSGVGVENGVEALGQFVRNKSVLVEAGKVEAVFAKL